MKNIFPWWLAALLGIILYPALTYLPVYFLDPQMVLFCKNAAPIICFGLFLYGGMAIYENPIENTIREQEHDENQDIKSELEQ